MFLHGSTNIQKSAATDHSLSDRHGQAVGKLEMRRSGATGMLSSRAGDALKKMKTASRQRMSYLFRNAHAVAVQNRPLTDFTWICKLDRTKELYTGDTYMNDKGCLGFIRTVAVNVREGVSKRLQRASFMSFIMDGSTDISAEEQECVFVRSARNGVVSTNFLQISSPESTSSEHLFEHVVGVFEQTGLQTELDKGTSYNSQISVIFVFKQCIYKCNIKVLLSLSSCLCSV